MAREYILSGNQTTGQFGLIQNSQAPERPSAAEQQLQSLSTLLLYGLFVQVSIVISLQLFHDTGKLLLDGIF